MTSYTTKANYPYPEATDPVSAYPATAATFAFYLDNLPNRNAIINGQFDIWQRGTTFTNPATGAYTADRWRIAYDGAGGSRVVSQVSASLDFPGGMKPKFAAQIAITNRGTATTQTISQRIEGGRTFANEWVTISAYVRTTSGTLSVGVKSTQSYGTGGSPTSSVNTTLGTFTATTSWQRLRYTTQLNPLSGTFGTNGDDYVEILFDLGTQTGTLQIWGVQVEQNTTATSLERRPIQQELALCQRYYFEVTGQTIVRNHAAYTNWLTPLSFPVQMRKQPTVVGRRSKTGTINEFDADGGGVVATIAYGAHTPNEATIYATATTRNGVLWYSADAEL
jgi:hypothetical protein